MQFGPFQPEGTLIGIGGRINAGKDAVSNFLVDAFGYSKIGMSEVLNEFISIQNPWVRLNEPAGDWNPGDFVQYADLLKEVGYENAKVQLEVRKLLQVTGTKAGRNLLGNNVWTEGVSNRIISLFNQNTPVVVSGIRYPNELQMIHTLGGFTIWIAREGNEQPESISSFESETRLQPSDFDERVINDGSIAELTDKVQGLLELREFEEKFYLAEAGERIRKLSRSRGEHATVYDW